MVSLALMFCDVVGQESMLSVVKDNAAQLLKQFGLEDDMENGGGF